jgi:hypothetical protein
MAHPPGDFYFGENVGGALRAEFFADDRGPGLATAAACVAAAMQTGHISSSSQPKTVSFLVPTMGWLLSGRHA